MYVCLLDIIVLRLGILSKHVARHGSSVHTWKSALGRLRQGDGLPELLSDTLSQKTKKEKKTYGFSVYYKSVLKL